MRDKGEKMGTGKSEKFAVTGKSQASTAPKNSRLVTSTENL